MGEWGSQVTYAMMHAVTPLSKMDIHKKSCTEWRAFSSSAYVGLSWDDSYQHSAWTMPYLVASKSWRQGLT